MRGRLEPSPCMHLGALLQSFFLVDVLTTPVVTFTHHASRSL